MTVSNNQDMEIIIATVIQTIRVFIALKPDAKVLFMGSTPSRTRLYRGVINKYIAQAEQVYEIHGIIDWINEPFNGSKNYDAFLIFQKKTNQR
jgi:polysaccharide pyruvyl transferase WcaK-like protein